jgi:hypothetical protein
VQSFNLKKRKHKNEFNKSLFNSNSEADVYYPFGAPGGGGGAPIRNGNKITSRLPHVEDHLFKANNNTDSPSPTKSPRGSDFSFINDTKRSYMNNNKKQDWNDWFGKPGGGARINDTRKQNLDQMLEPRNYEYSQGYVPYDPTYDPAQSLSPRSKFKSNHHNNYEVPPPPR